MGTRNLQQGGNGQRNQHPPYLDAAPVYRKRTGVRTYLEQVYAAPPMQIVEIERSGVDGAVLVDLAKRLELPLSRLLAILNVPRSTALRRIAAGTRVGGHAGQAVVGLAKLHHIAQDMIDSSTAEAAKDFDVLKWLGRWLEQPQPCLGGNKPGDLMDTPMGILIVTRSLGAIMSGAYQ